MSFSHTQLEALESAIATGTLEVRIDDKVVKYQTTSELIKARDLVRNNPYAKKSVRIFSDNFKRVFDTPSPISGVANKKILEML